MIELGTLSVTKMESLPQTRHKVLHLAESLGLGNIDATRLSTIFSEIVRAGCRAGGTVAIQIGLDTESTPATLFFFIQSDKNGFHVQGLRHFFDQVDVDKGPDDGAKLTVSKHLPDSRRTPSRDLVAKIQEKLALLSREELLDRLRSNNEQLAEARDAAEAATRAKSDFLARMSHEIRTPMNAIIGMTHLALQTELTSKQFDYINKANISAHALLGIINDILDFSKIEAGKLEIEAVPFDLEEVLDNMANLLALKAEDKGVELMFRVDAHIPQYLIGDPLRLGQILTNLTNNAVKFTDSGEIVIAVTEVAQAGNEVTLQFSVKDTGIGLSDEQIDHLFQSFSQADGSTTRKYGGTGLGLAICRRLTEMMGGKIWVESKLGEGSTFSFTAAFGVSDDWQGPSLLPATDIRGLRALVVDDNQAARSILSGVLESFSFHVDTATSGQEALEALRAASPGAPYELVLMDWKMPGMNGIEAATRIMENPELATIPKILMVSAYGREEIMQAAAKAGIQEFLVKPISNSSLFDTIMGVFGFAGSRQRRSARTSKIDADVLGSIRGARILLVEDNAINQQVATELLEKAQFRVSLANNGKEAVQKASSGGFDLVLMDIEMPEMDGIEATRRIRESGKAASANVPIVAMTAHAMAGDREKSLRAGMNDHVTKPIDPDELFAALLRWIVPGAREVPPEPPPLASDTSDVPLPDVPGINAESGLARVGGNRTLYRDLIRQFARDYADANSRLGQLLEEGDFDTARRLAHTVKGVAGNIGAQEVHESARAVEAAIEGGATKDWSALVDAFGETLGAVLQSLRAAGLCTEGESRPLDTALSPLDLLPAELIDEMAEALEGGYTDRLRALVNDVMRVNADLGKQMGDLAENYEYEGLLRMLHGGHRE